MVAGGGDASFPAREAVRVPAPVVRVDAVPEGFAAVEPRPLTAVFRRRETGGYGEAPYVEEWKPLPPRLHDFVEVERPAPRGRFAISVRDVQTGLDLAEARAYAASVGARLPTEDEWQLAAEAGVLDFSGAARLELDRERALRRAHALRDPQGRLRLGGRGLGLVRRRRPAGAGVLAEAAAARRRAWRARRGSASGWRSICREAARRHPRRRGGDALRGAVRRDAARRLRRRRDQDRASTATRSGPWPRAEQGRRRALVQEPGAEQASRHARPLEAGGRRHLPPAGGGSRRRPRELPAGNARALGARLGRALCREPAARAGASDRLRTDGARMRTGPASARSPRR